MQYNQAVELSNFVKNQKLNLLRKATAMAYGHVDTNFLISKDNMFLYNSEVVHEAFNSLGMDDPEIRVVKTDLVYALVDRVMRSVVNVCGPLDEEIKLRIVDWEEFNVSFVSYLINFRIWIPRMYYGLYEICTNKDVKNWKR